MRSGGHAGTGDRCGPVVEAADVDDPIAPQGQDLPALRRSACLASRRRAGDLKPPPEVSPVPAVTSVTTARAPAARALAHHATTWSRFWQSAS
jgi:hypothetical protein